MELEEKHVLLDNNTANNEREQEWWFSYCFDLKQNVCFSWYFLRTYATDYFRFQCFRPGGGPLDIFDRAKKQWYFEKEMALPQTNRPNQLDLTYEGDGLKLSYEGDREMISRFSFTNEAYRADLSFERSKVPPFVRRETDLDHHYTLLHYFKNGVTGRLKMGDDSYNVETHYSYYDHCFGTMPARWGHHWLAVQNDEIALTALTGYGANTRKYSQIFFQGEWIRLSPDVTFEYDARNPLNNWRLTSPDLDLELEIIDANKKTTEIPAAKPAIHLKRNECFVILNGKIKIDAQWHEVKHLRGVMEEQQFNW